MLTCTCVLTLMLALANLHLDTYTWMLALAHSHLDTDTWILTVGYLLTFTSHLLSTSHFLYVLPSHICPHLLVSLSTSLHASTTLHLQTLRLHFLLVSLSGQPSSSFCNHSAERRVVVEKAAAFRNRRGKKPKANAPSSHLVEERHDPPLASCPESNHEGHKRRDARGASKNLDIGSSISVKSIECGPLPPITAFYFVPSSGYRLPARAPFHPDLLSVTSTVIPDWHDFSDLHELATKCATGFANDPWKDPPRTP